MSWFITTWLGLTLLICWPIVHTVLSSIFGDAQVDEVPKPASLFVGAVVAFMITTWLAR